MSRSIRRRGFSLIELTIALGVAAISLIGIFALLPIGLHTSYNASEQTASNDILTAVIGDLKATPKPSPPQTSSTSVQFNINVPNNAGGSAVTLYFDSNGKKLGSSPPAPPGARYCLTISFPASSGAKSPTYATLRMTWPAAADPAKAIGSAETFVTLDRN